MKVPRLGVLRLGRVNEHVDGPFVRVIKAFVGVGKYWALRRQQVLGRA